MIVGSVHRETDRLPAALRLQGRPRLWLAKSDSAFLDRRAGGHHLHNSGPKPECIHFRGRRAGHFARRA